MKYKLGITGFIVLVLDIIWASMLLSGMTPTEIDGYKDLCLLVTGGYLSIATMKVYKRSKEDDHKN